MPAYVVERVALALNEVRKPVNGSRICILGIAYKRDVDDPRESPAFQLMELLAARGAHLSYSDPFIPRLPKMRHFDVAEMASSELTKEYLSAQDCVLIVTDHSSYDYEFIAAHSRLIVDTRNALRAVKGANATIVGA
jgi:UDP-N-acetyl-D-glucosamine dehydrogenase